MKKINIKIEHAKKLFNEKKLSESLDILKNLKNLNRNDLAEEKILRAAIYVRMDRIEEALQLIDNVEKELGGESLATCNIKAIAYRNQKNNQKALEILQSGLAKYPNSVDLAHNLSVTSADMGKLDLAETAGLSAININPNHIETYKNLGRVYVTQRDTEKAINLFQRLNLIDPESVDVLVGMGAVELLNSHPAKAIPFFEKALNKNENLNAAWANLGICKKYLNDYQGAKKCLEIARIKDPNQVEHIWNLALVNLALGNFEDGWPQYEIRYSPNRIAIDAVKMPNTKIPMLRLGDSVVGKTVVLVQEQGYGDTIQFFRLAKLLKNEGAIRIIAMVAPEMTEVVKSIPWIDEVAHEMLNPQKVPDYWTFSMSLPARYQFKTVDDIPQDNSYISIDAEKEQYWKQYLHEKCGDEKLRVGLVWAGRESHSNDANRSITYQMLEPLLSLSDQVQFIALQKGSREKDAMNDLRTLSCGHLLQNFADSAALLSNMDLLISIDSSPVHLGGALGMPVWALIPAFFDFRWLIDREDSPWYPSMKLFRQHIDQPWAEVIQEVRSNLELFIKNRNKRWTANRSYIHPDFKNSQIAGTTLFLNSAFKFHLQGNLSSAEYMYIRALENEPKSIDAIRNLASLYRSLGKLVESESLYRQGEGIGIEDPIFYTNYANLLVDLKKYEEAMKKAQKAINISPNHELAHQVIERCKQLI